MPKPPRQRPTGAHRPTLVPHVQPINVGSPAVPDSGTAEVRDSRTPGVPDSRSPALPDSGTPEIPKSGSTEVRESGTTGLPKYQRMERRDARLRPDQWQALGELRSRLQRQRRDRTERITDNTMLRLAVDLLLTHGDRLTGDTEDAMRAALGLPDSGSPGLR